MSNRPSLPEKLRQELLYESAHACVICQERRVQIHHIDQDNTNNDPENLVVVCHNHHDDAHSQRKLSQNLTPTRLRAYKKNWLADVTARRAETASLAGQLRSADEWLRAGVTWGYINYRRVSQLIDDQILASVNQENLQRCIAQGVVDVNGIVIRPNDYQPSANYLRNTIYDWFEHGDDFALHKLYSEIVDEISKRVSPTHLNEFSWTKEFVGNCVQPGQFLFFTKAQYFKKVSEDQENAHIKVHTKRRKARLEYFVDSVGMFGTTSITVSFTGHNSCSSLVQVKSVDRSSEEWVLRCTPIALGVGFRPSL